MAAPVGVNDLNALVAIVTARIGATEIPGTTIRVDKQTITGVLAQHTRFIPVLDAFASLAVCDKESQVVAVALRRQNPRFELIIAENGVVNPRVLTHIGGLWTILMAYPTLSTQEKELRKLEMVKSVYIHSYPKLYRRFTKRKWLEDLEYAFNDRVKNLAGTTTLVTGALEVISALVTVRKQLDLMTIWRKTVTPKRSGGNRNIFPTDPSWVKLITEMDDAIADIEQVMKNEPSCKEWAHALKGIGGLPAEPIELFRAIQKLTSHHRHINHLLRYAETPDAQDDFGLEFSVVGNEVDPLNQTITIPDNSAPGHGLENMIMPFLPLGVDQDDEIVEVGSAVQRTFGGDLPHTCDGTVHCECSLIANFNPGPPHPINYIGVSKLSCAACYAWIQAYNATQQVQFYTQGTHGRWYAKWAIPSRLVEEAMLAKMRAVVGQAYKSFLAAGAERVQRIVISDSTEAEDIIPGPWITVPAPIGRTQVRSSAASRTARLANRTAN